MVYNIQYMESLKFDHIKVMLFVLFQGSSHCSREHLFGNGTLNFCILIICSRMFHLTWKFVNVLFGHESRGYLHLRVRSYHWLSCNNPNKTLDYLSQSCSQIFEKSWVSYGFLNWWWETKWKMASFCHERISLIAPPLNFSHDPSPSCTIFFFFYHLYPSPNYFLNVFSLFFSSHFVFPD